MESIADRPNKVLQEVYREEPEQASNDSISKEDVTIVLPILNEEKAIPRVLDELNRNGYRKILLVDGYSTDKTIDILKEYYVPVIQQHGRGKTGAIKTALEHVSTSYLLIMDGDYTYAAADIEKFLPHARHYDQIIGARSRANGKSLSQSHRLGNKIITKAFNFLFGTNLSDVLSGMYLLNTKVARKMQLDSADFTVEVEIAAQSALVGNVTEVPVGYRERVGKQKLSTWKDGPKILSAIVKLARLYNPTFLLSLGASLTMVPGLIMLFFALSQYLTAGVISIGWTLAGMILVLFGSQALAAGTISLLMKRMEHRLTKIVTAQISQNAN